MEDKAVLLLPGGPLRTRLRTLDPLFVVGALRPTVGPQYPRKAVRTLGPEVLLEPYGLLYAIL